MQTFISVGNVTSASVSGLTLATSTKYYVSVKALDTLGNVSTAVSSNGVTVDATPPSVGTVNDGADVDIAFQVSTTTMSANWSGFSDTGSGIASYQWAIGTSAGGTDVQSFTSVGSATNASVSGLTLTSGTKYYVSVKTLDALGNVSTVVSSNGVTVGTTASPSGTIAPSNGYDTPCSRGILWSEPTITTFMYLTTMRADRSSTIQT